MTLDNIQAGADTTMTEELLRLFKYADCDPTVCHACDRRIKVGNVFKLLPHRRYPEAPLNDEMVCARCDEAALVRRDKRVDKQAAARPRSRSLNSLSSGGFSRPSKAPQEGKTP